MSLKDAVHNIVNEQKQATLESNTNKIDKIYITLAKELNASIEEVKLSGIPDYSKGQVTLNLPECTSIIVKHSDNIPDLIQYIYEPHSGDGTSWQFPSTAKISTEDIKVAIKNSHDLFVYQEKEKLQQLEDEELYKQTSGSDYAEVGRKFNGMRKDIDTFMITSQEDEDLLSQLM